MYLDVKFLPSELKNTDDLQDKICIVLDIFRASSTITKALHNGCIAVKPIADIEATRAEKLLEPQTLLAGERQSIKIAGFDLGNSPLEFTAEQVCGRAIAMNTSNGTKAILACSKAYKVLIGAFINAEATVEIARSSGRDIVIVCAGTEGEFSIEDSLCAGYMVKLLVGDGYKVSDTAYASMLMYERTADNLEIHAGRSANGKRLYSIGLAEDVRYCLTRNYLKTVGCYSPDSKTIVKW